MLTRAKKKYKKDGISELLRSTPRFLWREFRPYKNKLGGILVEFNQSDWEYNGIKLNLENSRISRQLKGRFVFNEYESQESKLIDKHLSAEAKVIELGGCIGYVSCLLNEKLDNPTQHVVLEANPYLITTLEENRKLNESSFKIMNKAYSTKGGKIKLNLHKKFVGASVQRKTSETIEVDTIDLEDLLKKLAWSDYSLVCDIEGGEFELFRHERKFLMNAELIIVELHEFAGDKHQLLSEIREDFEIIDKKESSFVLKPY